MSVQIDQILVRVGSGHNMLTIDQWASMDVGDRVEILSEGRARFLSQGNAVAPRDALAAIKAARG